MWQTQLSNLNILVSEKKDGHLQGRKKVINFLKQQGLNKDFQHLTLMNKAKRILSQNYSKDNDQADAIMGNLKQNPNLCLSFVTGDCFPLIVYDFKTGSLALIHCGWQPLFKNIIELTIKDLQQYFNSQIKDMLFWIGPGIRACCYDSPQLPLQAGDPKWDRVIKQKSDYHWTIDLAAFIKNELMRLGAHKNQIFEVAECTACSKNADGDYKYFSHHRGSTAEERKSRFVTAVWQD